MPTRLRDEWKHQRTHCAICGKRRTLNICRQCARRICQEHEIRGVCDICQQTNADERDARPNESPECR
ncbi:MAG TPA: hypothetical protein VH539_15065 [Gemmatimonadaceae bacterium]|jgi:ribosomal protein S14